MNALDIVGLSRRFHRDVLRALDLSVPAGELTAILGASGSGKTTLLRLICGFERPDSGTIAINGRPVAGPTTFIPPEHRHVGYVAQDGALFPHLSVRDNILFGLKRPARTAIRADELLDLVGLSPAYASRPPQELSGGEQQRVALARALAPAPPLVLLDEPFSALDAALRVETRRAVAGAIALVGATALLVTHDQSEALSMGARVAVLRDGRLVQLASPTTLYRHPVDAELARFVGEAILVPGTAAGRAVRCALGTLGRDTDRPDGPVEILIRPEQIRLFDQAGEHAARVTEITYYGHDASIRLELPDGLILQARTAGHAAPPLGALRSLAIEGDVVTYPVIAP